MKLDATTMQQCNLIPIFLSLIPDFERHFDVLFDRPEPHIPSILGRNYHKWCQKSKQQWIQRCTGVDHRHSLGLQHNKSNLDGERKRNFDNEDFVIGRRFCWNRFGAQKIFDVLVDLQQFKHKHSPANSQWIYNEAHSCSERWQKWLVEQTGERDSTAKWKKEKAHLSSQNWFVTFEIFDENHVAILVTEMANLMNLETRKLRSIMKINEGNFRWKWKSKS